MTNLEISTKTNPKKELRTVDKEDLGTIADIHIAAFPTSSWTRLGKIVVEKYYLWQLNAIHPLVMSKSCYLDGKCVGFCFSGIFKGSTSGFIGTYRNLLIKRTLMKPWLVLLPEFRNRLMSTKKLLKQFVETKNMDEAKNIRQSKIAKLNEKSSYGILSIAVLPQCQGYGIGKILINDAETNAREHCFEKMHLTVNTKNNNAIAFYEKLGWKRIPSNDSWNGRMEKDLHKTN